MINNSIADIHVRGEESDQHIIIVGGVVMLIRVVLVCLVVLQSQLESLPHCHV